jgi:hypothetical protein
VVSVPFLRKICFSLLGTKLTGWPADWEAQGVPQHVVTRLHRLLEGHARALAAGLGAEQRRLGALLQPPDPAEVGGLERRVG